MVKVRAFSHVVPDLGVVLSIMSSLHASKRSRDAITPERNLRGVASNTTQALQSIDRDISSSLDYRRKPRDGVSSASAFYDTGTFAKSPFAGIPEALRPKPGRLSNTQERVYELESLITKDTREAEIQGVIAEVPEMILKCVFKSLYENVLNSIHIVSHLAILAAIRDVCKLVVKELTSWQRL
ncbi:hypothetical protein MRB53_006500 [Persea americana]|uniref:Uncharacterized protein n=1 Tax=Persea americana TaxID=3435 RepID=A0ACC2MGC7_PERAE|nr:hypothetical protein MRB53_006500 [Persea americana]